MTRALPVLVAASALLACTRGAEPRGPVPLSVVPGQSTGEAEVRVEIAGRDFDASIRSDFGASGGATMDVRFLAELQPVDGGEAVALRDVTLTARRTLRATVPTGLAHGAYRLRVTDPAGRTGALDQAFRIVTPAEAVASFRVDLLEAPQAGIAFPVALTAVDPQGLVVDGFVGSVSLADASGTLAPASAGPFAAGRLQVRATIPGLVTGDRITVADALGRSGTSEPFDVVAGPPMTIVFPQRSVTAAAGACSPAVDVELRDVLGHPAPAGTDLTARLQAAPPEAGFFSDAACTAAATAVTVRAGASRASFHFRAAAPGMVTVRVLPVTLPSASQDETVSP